MADLGVVIYDEPQILATIDEQLPPSYYGSLEDYVVNLIRANQPSAGAATETAILGTALSALTVVTKSSANQLIRCNPSTAGHMVGVAGILLQAGQIGDTVSYQSAGELVDSSWNWTPSNPIFVSQTGALTQVVPVNYPLIAIGWAITSDRINVQVFQRIVRTN
ncbi:MAG: hypothetical protein ACRC62_15730 [Microcoleus sp.]